MVKKPLDREYFAYCLILRICDVDILGGVDHHAGRRIQLRGVRVRAVLDRSRAAPGKGADTAGGIHLSDHVVQRVGNVTVSGDVERDRVGPVELRVGLRSVIARVSRGAISGVIHDRAGINIHSADAVVPRVGDVKVPPHIDGDSQGLIELRGSSRTAVARVSLGPVSSHGSNVTGGSLRFLG